MCMGSRGATWMLNLVLLAMACLVGLLGVEGGLRLLHMDSPLVWEPDRQLGWRGIPGARRYWTEEGNSLIQINSQGYRDHERQLTKPPGTFRVAVFGDSVTEAVQVNVEQTFCSLLEQRVPSANPRIEILNFGISGYSPIQELLLFQREGPRYRPDLILWVLFLDNDVSGVHPDLTVVSQAGPPYVRFEGATPTFDSRQAEKSFVEYHREPLHTLRHYSAIYRFLSSWRWRRNATQQSQAARVGQIPKRFLLYQTPQQPVWEEAWLTFERVVLAFAAEANRQNIPFFILSAPAAQVVNTQAWAALLQQFPAMTTGPWDLEQPERRLRAFAQQHHFLLLQPYQRFQAASTAPPLFFGNLGHMTAHGHQLMAQVLGEFFVDHHLVPGKP